MFVFIYLMSNFYQINKLFKNYKLNYFQVYTIYSIYLNDVLYKIEKLSKSITKIIFNWMKMKTLVQNHIILDNVHNNYTSL